MFFLIASLRILHLYNYVSELYCSVFLWQWGQQGTREEYHDVIPSFPGWWGVQHMGIEVYDQVHRCLKWVGRRSGNRAFILWCVLCNWNGYGKTTFMQYDSVNSLKYETWQLEHSIYNITHFAGALYASTQYALHFFKYVYFQFLGGISEYTVLNTKLPNSIYLDRDMCNIIDELLIRFYITSILYASHPVGKFSFGKLLKLSTQLLLDPG